MTERWCIEPAAISGNVEVPGDKSMAHRALMLAALANGESEINNMPQSDAIKATASCLRELGVGLDWQAQRTFVRSSGILLAPQFNLDTGNSGTAMRLLCGLLAGQPFSSCLVGDPFLSRRPMGRIIGPLVQMGAVIRSHHGMAPLNVEGGPLQGIDYTLPVPSAQVKSAILLAGLFAQGQTVVRENVPSRDHTERLMRSLAIPVSTDGICITLQGPSRPGPFRAHLPGDFSSAAFFFAAALLTGGSVTATRVGVNPTRIGFLEVIERMGAHVSVRRLDEAMGEPVADVTVSGRLTRSCVIAAQEVPRLIDELPLIALLATCAPGVTTVSGAEELRVKETDRIAGITAVLAAFGAQVEARPDGFAVRGGARLKGARIAACEDHRLTMMACIAACCAVGPTVIEDPGVAGVSFPTFGASLQSLGGKLLEA